MYKTTKLVFLLLVFWTAVIQTEAGNILMYTAFGNPSHKFAYIPIANALVDRGHQVTILSSFKDKKATKYEDLMLPKVYDVMKRGLTIDVFKNRIEGGILLQNLTPLDLVIPICEAFLQSEEAKDISSGKRKFDIIMVDVLANECAIGLAALTNASVVYYNTADLMPQLVISLGLPTSIIYTPLLVPFSRMSDINNLWNRVAFAISEIVIRVYRQHFGFPQLQKVWEDHLGFSLPDLYAVEQNTSIVFVNSHPTVRFPQPYLANIIDVGGAHITPPKPLSKELEAIIAGSGDAGFILCSFGSLTQSKSMPKEYQRAFLQAFGKLKQRVIWKFESEPGNLENVPSNVFVQNWVPQNDLLGHPKIRGFITHGGKLSLLESVHYGVPIFVIPFFGDQEYHAKIAEKSGFGIYFEAVDVLTEVFPTKLKELVDNPKYKSAALIRSSLFRDQPQSPIDRAVYWMEWVLRHPHEQHLLPESRKWNWFSFHLVDVWAVIILIVTLPILIFFLILRSIYRCCCRKSSPKRKLKKN